MSVGAETPHFQSQAVAMLAIATGALGFGLFGSEFRVSMELLHLLKVWFGLHALAVYTLLVKSVGEILKSGDVTGRQVVEGPLMHMWLVVSSTAVVWIVEVIQDQSGSRLTPA